MNTPAGTIGAISRPMASNQASGSQGDLGGLPPLLRHIGSLETEIENLRNENRTLRGSFQQSQLEVASLKRQLQRSERSSTTPDQQAGQISTTALIPYSRAQPPNQGQGDPQQSCGILSGSFITRITFDLLALTARETGLSTNEACRRFEELYHYSNKFAEEFCTHPMRITNTRHPQIKNLAATLGNICEPSLLQTIFDSAEKHCLIAACINRKLRDSGLAMANIETLNSPLVTHIKRCHDALATYSSGKPSDHTDPKRLLELISGLWLQFSRTPVFSSWFEREVNRVTDDILLLLNPVIPHARLREASGPMHRIVWESFSLGLYLKQRAFEYVIVFNRFGDELMPTMKIWHDPFRGRDIPEDAKAVKVGITPTVVQRDYKKSLRGYIGREVSAVYDPSVLAIQKYALIGSEGRRW